MPINMIIHNKLALTNEVSFDDCDMYLCVLDLFLTLVSDVEVELGVYSIVPGCAQIEAGELLFEKWQIQVGS